MVDFIKMTLRKNWKIRIGSYIKSIAEGKNIVYLWKWLVLLFFVMISHDVFFKMCGCKDV